MFVRPTAQVLMTKKKKGGYNVQKNYRMDSDNSQKVASDVYFLSYARWTFVLNTLGDSVQIQLSNRVKLEAETETVQMCYTREIESLEQLNYFG